MPVSAPVPFVPANAVVAVCVAPVHVGEVPEAIANPDGNAAVADAVIALKFCV